MSARIRAGPLRPARRSAARGRSASTTGCATRLDAARRRSSSCRCGERAQLRAGVERRRRGRAASSPVAAGALVPVVAIRVSSRHPGHRVVPEFQNSRRCRRGAAPGRSRRAPGPVEPVVRLPDQRRVHRARPAAAAPRRCRPAPGPAAAVVLEHRAHPGRRARPRTSRCPAAQQRRVSMPVPAPEVEHPQRPAGHAAGSARTAGLGRVAGATPVVLDRDGGVGPGRAPCRRPRPREVTRPAAGGSSTIGCVAVTSGSVP